MSGWVMIRERHEPQYMLAGPIDQQASGQTFAHNDFRIHLELHPLQEPETAYFFHHPVSRVTVG